MRVGVKVGVQVKNFYLESSERLLWWCFSLWCVRVVCVCVSVCVRA